MNSDMLLSFHIRKFYPLWIAFFLHSNFKLGVQYGIIFLHATINLDVLWVCCWVNRQKVGCTACKHWIMHRMNNKYHFNISLLTPGAYYVTIMWRDAFIPYYVDNSTENLQPVHSFDWLYFAVDARNFWK